MSTSSTIAYVGAGASAALAVMAVVDQVSAHWTKDDVASHYGSYGLHPDPNLLTMLLIVALACAAVFFLWSARADQRGKTGLTRWLGLAVAVCGIAFALLASAASEYGGPVLVTIWRVLPWLVPVLALAHILTVKSPNSRRVSA